MHDFRIIVAIDSDRGIGKDGVMPWNVPEDMTHFKEITTATTTQGKKNVVVMGRKTWESIPARFRPLSGRINIVLTRDSGYQLPTGVLRADSFAAVFSLLAQPALSTACEHVYVIGGQQVFVEALAYGQCSRLYITQINARFSCDTFFPPFEDRFVQCSKSPMKRSTDGNEFYFLEYKNKCDILLLKNR